MTKNEKESIEGLEFYDQQSITQKSCIKTCIKLRTNKVISHLNRMSVKTYGRKINKKMGFSDNRLGTNRETTTDSTSKEKHKYV